MSVILVGRFLEDRSTTSIAYKRYGETQEDTYPTYSICFKGTHFYWRYELAIFNEYELYSHQWENVLRGESAVTYHYEATSRLYRKHQFIIKQWSKFDSLHFEIKDILEKVNFTAMYSTHSEFHDSDFIGNVSEDHPFHFGYQTPEMICFTRNSKSNTIRSEDVLMFNEAIQYDPHIFPHKNITDKNAHIDIYVHYPGQFIRSLDSPSFTSSFLDYHWDKTLELKLSQGTILRKRSDYASQCKNITDYDRHFQEVVCNKTDTSCIPPYWKKSLDGVLDLKECATQTQMKAIYNHMMNYKDLLDHSDAPCIDMYNAVASNWNARQGRNDTKQKIIKFLYTEKYYEEIQYSKAFDVEGFISNLGGFVGIFLGYSLMQLPGLLGRYMLVFFLVYSKCVMAISLYIINK